MKLKNRIFLYKLLFFEIVRQQIWGFSATGNERAFRNGALIVVHEHMQIGSWPTIFVHGGQKRCVHERPLIEG